MNAAFLNIYGQNIEQLNLRSACSVDKPFLAWEVISWTQRQRLNKSTLDLQNICKQKDNLLFDITKPLPKDKADMFCTRFGGSLYLPQESDEMEDYLKKSIESEKNETDQWQKCYSTEVYSEK